MDFRARLDAAWQQHDSLLCVGLDPDPERFPAGLRDTGSGLRDFLFAIVEATADQVCAFKPQIAHFAALGAEDVLGDVIGHIRRQAPGVLVILDAKRGDIGSTARLYAREAFERYGADAVTVNPWLGLDGIAPFLEYTDRGTVVLCRTSNASSDELQANPRDPEPLYERVARLVEGPWNTHGNLMLVAGATHPHELARIRALAPDVPLLVPGFGAQGGDATQIVEGGLDARGRGLVINSSRAILYAGSGDDFAARAREAAIAARATLADAVTEVTARGARRA